jgi:PAS domain S-box-containing protein
MNQAQSPSAPSLTTREKILLVDDSPENLTALEAVLESLGQELIKANSGFEALRHCLDHDFAAIILDVKMPEMDGFETASLIRSRRRSQHTPILFLTGFRNEEHLFRGYDLGAVDFLFKPIVSEVLQSKVSVFVELSRNSALLRSQAEEIRSLNLGLERKIAERTAELVADITERRRAEEALKESEQRLRVAMEAANLGLWSIDVKSRKLTVSTRSCEMFGFDEHFNGDLQALHDVIDSEDQKQVSENLARALSGEAEFDCEFRVANPDARLRWVACRGSLLQDTNEISPRLVGVSQDVTERKTAEDIVRHKHKLESLGILAGGIAHDFNNLLTGVLGNASIVLDDESLTTESRECIESVVLAAENAAQLTRQMLAYSGRGRFIVEPVHLSNRIRELQPLLVAAIPKNVVLDLDLKGELPHVDMDTAQLHQLILNLVLNAAEAVGPEQGCVKVSTRLQTVTDEMLRFSPVGREIAVGEYVTLVVTDNGHGMDEKTLSKIFDPFFTTKFTGRGLGLAAVMGIVRGHKGAIDIESQPGKGTTFTVYFPPSTRTIERPAVTKAPLKQSNGVVLVVDDEDIVRNTARMALERSGFTVVVAKNGLECVELVANSRNKFEVVLLDMAMPVMSGEQAFKKLIELRPGTPVVATSGYDETETVARFGDGLAGFLQKPYTAGQLITKIQALTQSPRNSETENAKP